MAHAQHWIEVIPKQFLGFKTLFCSLVFSAHLCCTYRTVIMSFIMLLTNDYHYYHQIDIKLNALYRTGVHLCQLDIKLNALYRIGAHLCQLDIKLNALYLIGAPLCQIDIKLDVYVQIAKENVYTLGGASYKRWAEYLFYKDFYISSMSVQWIRGEATHEEYRTVNYLKENFSNILFTGAQHSITELIATETLFTQFKYYFYQCFSGRKESFLECRQIYMTFATKWRWGVRGP